MIIFIKRYIKGPLFFLCIISALSMYFLYEKTDLSLNSNLNIGIYSTKENRLEDKLLSKNSYFKYKKYYNIDDIKSDISKGKINYGFKIDFDDDIKFTLYGSDSKFSEIAKEDFYSTYFEILSYDYTKNLLNLSDNLYKKMYEKQLKRTFSFEYVDDDISKIFPIKDISSFLLLILSLLVCYDYFSLSEKTDFFRTFSGRKMKFKFIFSGILMNFLIYYIMLSFCMDINLLYFLLYLISLFYLSIICIHIFKYKNYRIFMPLYIIMSFISIFANKLNSLKLISLIFINNWLLTFEFAYPYFIAFLFLIILLSNIFLTSFNEKFYLE